MLKKKFVFALMLLLLLAPMGVALADGGDDRFEVRVRNDDDNDFNRGAFFNRGLGVPFHNNAFLNRGIGRFGTAGFLTPEEKILLHKIMVSNRQGLIHDPLVLGGLSSLNHRLVGLGHPLGVGTFGLGLDGRFLNNRFNNFGVDRDIRLRVEDDRIRFDNKADDDFDDIFDNDRDFRLEVRNDRNNDFDFDGGGNSGRG